MESNVKNLKQYIGLKSFAESNKAIVIPICQREYEWEKENIEDFIKDLIDDRELWMERKNNGYIPSLGIIYTHIKNESNSEIILYDGQQRISTLLLIAKYLGIFEDLKVTINAELKIYNKEIQQVFKEGNTDGDSNLSIAYNNVANELQKHFGKKPGLENSFKNYILNELYIFEFRCYDQAFAINTFLKLNNRGKPLTFLDLLKSYLKQHQEDFKPVITDENIQDFATKTYAKRKEEKEKLIDAYSALIKIYKKHKIPDKEKDKFDEIVGFIISSKKNQKIFFREWYAFSKIYMDYSLKTLTFDNGFELNKNTKTYKKCKTIFHKMKDCGFQEYLPLIVLTSMFENLGYVSEKNANIFLNKILTKYISTIIPVLMRISEDEKVGKFNSDELCYKNIFDAINNSSNEYIIDLTKEIKWDKAPKGNESWDSDINKILSNAEDNLKEKECKKLTKKVNALKELLEVLGN